jgi:hypothetical protein
MLYGHDIFKLARIKERMEFCAHEMINMLQNASNGQSITKQHYIHSVYAAFLSYYGGGTSQYDGNCFPHPVLFCIKGMGGGQAKILWIMHPCWYRPPDKYNNPTIRNAASDRTHKIEFSLIKQDLNTIVNETDIWPSLHIEEGKIKMILEVELFSQTADHANFIKNLGFFILRPKPSCPYSFFNTVVIFTPKPGLFSETLPE